MSVLKERIREYILEQLAPGLGPDGLGGQTPLFGPYGVVTSLSIIDLVAWMEAELSFRVEAHEITVENFGTVDDLVRFIDGRKGATS